MEGRGVEEGRKRALYPKTPQRFLPRTSRRFCYIVRMDQPYSRIADSLLDYQYWSPNDPQRTPYDDTGWTFPELFNTQAVRVADIKVLDAPVDKVSDVRVKGAVADSGSIFLVNHNADVALATLRYRLKDASFEAAEEPFEAGGRKFNRGAFVIKNASAADVQKAASDLGPADGRDHFGAVGQDASGAHRPHRAAPHVVEHAERKAGGARHSTTRPCLTPTSAHSRSRRTTTSTRSST